MTMKGKSWDDSWGTKAAPPAAVRTTLDGMTTGEDSALDATTRKELLMLLCDIWGPEAMKTATTTTVFPTIVDITSEKLPSIGSQVFTWMYQQLSNTDWCGLPAASSSSSNLETVGKPETSDKGAAIEDDPAARISHLEMLMNAPTSTVSERMNYYEEWNRLHS